MAVIAQNRRARFDYEILETYEAGIGLKGFEVKSVKTGRINLGGSYVIIRNGEAWLINADISPYQPKNTPPEYDSKKSRRLLLTKKEIKYLTGKLREKRLTLVPLEVYTKNRLVKLKLGLVRPRKKIDKRELIRKRETAREIKRIIK
jgi:SsrA-binding protein